MTTVMNVVGARPQFVKAGPVSRALAEASVNEILVNTGQHYEKLLSETIMRDVGLREPDYNLSVGSGSHASQTARILEGVETLILETRPDAVLTYGDTNSTIAAALASTKLHLPTGHVEAGLRSFNRRMPEELNRVATDHLSDYLFAPTRTAMGHLEDEGLSERAYLTGDVMVDALTSIDHESVALPAWAVGDFYVATIHRPANTDDRARLAEVLKALGRLDSQTHLLAHPRLRNSLEQLDVSIPESLLVREPLPYAQMLGAVKQSRGLVTDSGGLQKEAFILGTPCTTIRDETEWPETLEGDWNVLAGSSLEQLSAIVSRKPTAVVSHPFGTGDAASKIVDQLTSLVAG